MTSNGHGTDRAPHSESKKDESEHHPVEHVATQETFSKDLTHTRSNRRPSTEQAVLTPSLPSSTSSLSSSSQVDFPPETMSKDQNGVQETESSKEGLSGTPESGDGRESQIEESTSVNRDTISKGFEMIPNESIATSRSMNEFQSQEQNTSSVLKEVRCPKQSNDARHDDQRASIGHLTLRDHQANKFTRSPLTDIHTADQSLDEEQRDGEHATAAI